MQLYREVFALGYTGGYHVVNRYVAAIRKGVAIPVRAVTPSPRDITSWIMRSEETLSPLEVAQLETVRNACPEIASACDLAREFTDMLRHRRGHLLRDWIQKAELGGPDAIGIFADPIRQALRAVTVGLTLSYSSGIVEGPRQQNQNDQTANVRSSLVHSAQSPRPPSAVGVTEERSEPTTTLSHSG
ncbi:hypothetical protein [Streptomyces sp. NPDC054797]